MTATDLQTQEVGVEFTDAHLAEVVVRERLQGSYCWTAGLGWLRWDGMRWRSATDREEVREEVRLWAIRHYQAAGLEVAEALRRGDKTTARGQEALAVGWKRTCSNSRLNAIVGLASGIVRKDAADFDQQPDLVNVRNGVVDLRTGELRPHDADLLFTKLAGCDYDPHATHSDWTKALAALPPDVQNWMQARIGQAATGHAPDDDVIPICQGGGKNGKSTIFAGVAHALGDFYTLVSDRVLLANSDAHPTELMDLRGARFALIEETPEARKLDVQRMKKITGTAAVTARLIAKDSVTFPVTHSLFITSNHRPVVEQTDYGTWRRLALVRFPYTFSGDGADPNLRDRIKRSGAVHRAVLAWIVRGAKAWYGSNRVTPGAPQQVISDTREWRAGSDLMLAYWQDRLIADPEANVATTALYNNFTGWLQERGQREWAERTFVDRFQDHEETERHNVERKRIRTDTARYMAWLGVRLRTPADLYESPSGQGGQANSDVSQVVPLNEKRPIDPGQAGQGIGFDLQQAS